MFGGQFMPNGICDYSIISYNESFADRCKRAGGTIQPGGCEIPNNSK
jgi:hypothetical protein